MTSGGAGRRRQPDLFLSPDRLAVGRVPPLIASNMGSHLGVFCQLDSVLGVRDVNKDESHGWLFERQIEVQSRSIYFSDRVRKAEEAAENA